MILLALLAHFAPTPLIRAFSKDPAVIDFGREYLKIASLNFVAAGIVFTSSSVFQGLGNTWPPLFSSASRLFLFVLPAVILSHSARFEIKHIWYLSVASQSIQAVVNLLLLRWELRKKLNFGNLDELAPAAAMPG